MACGCSRNADACHGAKSSVCVCSCGGACHGGRHGRAGSARSVTPERLVLAQMVMMVRRSRGKKRPKFSARSWRQRMKRIGFRWLGNVLMWQPSNDDETNQIIYQIWRLCRYGEDAVVEPRLPKNLRDEIDEIIYRIMEEGRNNG